MNGDDECQSHFSSAPFQFSMGSVSVLHQNTGRSSQGPKWRGMRSAASESGRTVYAVYCIAVDRKLHYIACRNPDTVGIPSSGSRISEPGFRQYGAPYPVPPDNIRYSVFGLWGLVCRSKGLAPWAMQVDVNSENLQHGQLRC